MPLAGDSPSSAGVRSDHRARRSRADAIVAGLGGLLTFCVYLATMFPGIHARGDAAKFSFVGPVLGTPHAPGYPLYMLVSYAFSFVPWGSLAFRMNLLSVVLGTAAVTIVYFICRRAGASRPAAFAIMLGLAFGDAFWSRALYAKGYTLNAALVAAGTLWLCRWLATRRVSHFYVAAAIFALSVGNHLINVALLPALVLFALSTDARTVLRPRTLATVALFVAAGLAQYSYILIRTWQRAPYLEARAENLSELWGVMTARRFAHEIGAFDSTALTAERIPHMWRLVSGEFGVIGLVLVVIGLAALAARRRQRELILFGLGAAGVIALTTNMASEEDEGFLLPALVLLWPIAAVGLEWLLQYARRAPRAVALTALIATFWVPIRQLSRNAETNNHHGDVQEIAYFDALFKALPDRAAILSDEYHLNQLVLYKIFGEGEIKRQIGLIGRDPPAVQRALSNKRDIFTFELARRELTAAGFSFVPFTFPRPAEATRREMFRLLGAGACHDIGGAEWLDLDPDVTATGRITIRIDNYRAFDAKVTLYLASASSGSATVVPIEGPPPQRVSDTWFQRSDARMSAALAARLAADHVTLPADFDRQPFVRRLEVDANDGGAAAVLAVDLGGTFTAGRVRAVVDQQVPRRARLCSYTLSTTDAWPDTRPSVTITPDSQLVDFAAGWYLMEERPDGLRYRWAGDRAVTVLPLLAPRDATVSVVAEPINYPGRTTSAMQLVVNGHRLETRSMAVGQNVLSWNVPRETWRAGLNNVTLSVDGARRPADVGLSGDQRMLGAAITKIELSATRN